MQQRSRAIFLAILSLSALCPGLCRGQGQERVSAFGEYEGWSEELYDEWVNESIYLEMRDGVKLAVDISRPARDGVAVAERYPVVWTHSRYHRSPGALMGRSDIRSSVDVNPALQRLVRHGYVLAAVGVRGSGASFGRFEGLFSAAETKDAAEVIAWFAEQPWCNGNVGMYGGSYLGITQYMAASEAPPALKAIFPDVAAFDFYELLYPGGVFRRDMMEHWDLLTRSLDRDLLAAPVDADPQGELRDAAVAEHASNWDVIGGYGSAPFRDHADEIHNWSQHGPMARLAAINKASIPAYHSNAWFDVFAMDALQWYVNFEGPQRLVMGNWSHAQRTPERTKITAIEQHRWFDRWLKDIPNGIDEEAPIRYAVIVDPDEFYWETAEEWPIEGTRSMQMHLGAGTTQNKDSLNDGLLSLQAGSAGRDVYKVDATTTTGNSSRWDNAVGATPLMRYGGLRDNDRKCLTYTTTTYAEDLIVVGHPLVRLFLSSSSGDVDLHILLEEIDARGAVHYVSEGVLRASQRKLSQPPYDNMGLPYHRCNSDDAEPLPADVPTEVVLDLQPIAMVINAGHRMRLSIMGADLDNTEASPLVDSTTLSLFYGGEQASGLELPVVD